MEYPELDDDDQVIPAGPVEEDRKSMDAAIDDLRQMGIEITNDDDDATENGGFTLGELQRLVENLETLNKYGPDLLKGQWSKAQGRYTLIGETSSLLPPGYYDTVIDQAGSIWFEPVRARTDKLLRFPDAATDKVIAEIETFWSREEIFEEFGLPFKRGILLYGPPGSGKTCTLQLLARDVVQRKGVVLIYQPEIFIHAYRQLRRQQPDTPVVVLMEDIDATLKRNNESTVLNTLDGTDTVHKTVFVATTNYPEELGERIINRPSRFDRRLFVSDPSDVARKMYLDDMIRGKKLPEGISIDQMVKDTRGMSLAHVKELFVLAVVIGADYKEAVKDLTEMHFEKPTSHKDRDRWGTFNPERGNYI
jgi:energy-coupling factor transporter ATP-binding protein EcfA2